MISLCLIIVVNDGLAGQVLMFFFYYLFRLFLLMINDRPAIMTVIAIMITNSRSMLKSLFRVNLFLKSHFYHESG